MADMTFHNVSELNFEVQWDDGLGQPLLKYTDNQEDLGSEETATDYTDTEVSDSASIKVSVTAPGPPTFSACNVYDQNDTSTLWAGGTKTLSLESGDEDREIAFTVAVTTKKTKGTPPRPHEWTDGWNVKKTDDDGTSTWVLDPYIRLTRTGYKVKAT